jgi:hypothetical protein
MSPTATIATVIAALIFFAWLFQSPTYDPGYEAWKKRQLEEKRGGDDSRRLIAAGNVVDPNTTEHRSLDEIREEAQRQRAAAAAAGISAQATVGTPIINPETADPFVDPFKTSVPIAIQVPGNGGTIDPQVIRQVDQQVRQVTFGSNHVLDGTFVGVAYLDDVAQESPKGEEPRITFRRDGTFTTRNMAAADVDMEAATSLGARIDRGTGRYVISKNILDLTYNDGLDRSKGNQRTYVIMPVMGSDDIPQGITIQGKLFKLETAR